MGWQAAPILGVRDVQATVDWFVGVLGFELTAPLFGVPGDEGPVYGIVHRDGLPVHVQIRRREVWTGEREAIETDVYVYVDDVDALYAEYVAAGVTVFREICDEDYGMRDFCIETPDGHRIAFGSPVG